MAATLSPDVVDLAFGGPALAHSVVFAVGVLVVVMLATRSRRTLRRRLLAVPIALFLHLVLDGMWTRTEVFWWPFFGSDAFGAGSLPSIDRPIGVVVAQEVAGAAALLWAYRRFRLYEPERRQLFVRTGHLGRDLRAAG
jgi:hypothetical protein